MFTDADLISSYTQADAIADGVLVDLVAVAPDVCKQHWHGSVICTAAVWAIIEAAVGSKSQHNDVSGILHDAFTVAKATGRILDEWTVLFTVVIKSDSPRSRYELKLVFGADDRGGPCVTLMMPDED